jgi:hypothetical protein
MAVRLVNHIHQIYQNVVVDKTAQFPILTSQLPFLVLALKNVRERKRDFRSGNQLVWEQLIRLLQDLQTWETNQTPIDLTELTALTRVLVGLKERRNLQKKLLERVAILARTDSQLRHLVETLLEQARRVLTFLLGQAQSLHEFLGFVPKEGKEFLDFSPRRELQELDEEGDYHNLAKEVGNTSFFLTESRLNFQNTFLENIQTIGTYLTEVNAR